MKRNAIVTATVILSMAGLAISHQAIAKKPGNAGGTSILHWMLNATMTNSGVEPGASGSVVIKQNKQGNANNQRLTISLAGLTAGTTYKLQALVGNALDYVDVADLTTDSNGELLVKYVKKNNGHGKAGGDALPNALDPISSIRSLAIGSSTTNLTVLSTDLTNPDSLQYLVKRNMTNDGQE